jgi:hypothetical protein
MIGEEIGIDILVGVFDCTLFFEKCTYNTYSHLTTRVARAIIYKEDRG